MTPAMAASVTDHLWDLEEPCEPSAPVDDRQLDLFAWKPRPRGPLQLNLLGEPEEVD